MKTRILTVDDSRTVHILVKKAFKNCGVEILMASNGVEGLSVAAKENPDLILLDITMPVMDGVEMLTRLKGDPQLKQIPVVMLTAEGGRDAVLKIAKMGIRDYIVKPFAEDKLLEKVGRIVDLNRVVQEKTILDSLNILVVEDKPVIVEAIKEGLAHLPWQLHAASGAPEGFEMFQDRDYDLVLVSLSLTGDSAFEFFKKIQQAKRKTPVIGMVVKTDAERQHRALQTGFDGMITKPLDIVELEMRACRIMAIDTSPRYFKFESNHMLVKLPAEANMARVAEINAFIKDKVNDAVDSGYKTVIIDASGLKGLDVNVIKLIIDIKNACRDMSLQTGIIGNEAIKRDENNFEETKSWKFADTAEEILAG
jgi:two-component system cell cycle response regulator